eukprot:5591749-Amphidinium_carterae.1
MMWQKRLAETGMKKLMTNACMDPLCRAMPSSSVDLSCILLLASIWVCGSAMTRSFFWGGELAGTHSLVPVSKGGLLENLPTL